MSQNDSSPPAEDISRGTAHPLTTRREADGSQHNPLPAECDCVEAELVWLLLAGEVPPPDTAGWRALFDLAEAISLRKLAAIRPLLAASDMDCTITNPYATRTRITSVLDCGQCGRATEVVHPIPREHFDQLPDTSWVRCEPCSPVREVA